MATETRSFRGRVRVLTNVDVNFSKPLAEHIQCDMPNQILFEHLLNIIFAHDASSSYYRPKVNKEHLRNIWNDPDFKAAILRRTTQQVDVYEQLAPPSAGQQEGAMSYVYDLMDNVNRVLLGTLHCYKNRDGSIGASGMPDPVLLLVKDVHLCDP